MSKLGGGGDSSAEDAARARQQQEADRRARIEQGMASIDEAFTPFDPAFYDARRTSYLDYYMPQLDDQFKRAQEQLIFDLARAGTGRSTIANEAQADLQEQYDIQRGSILDRAASYADEIRGNVNTQRNQLVNQLNATENPSIAASAAANASRAIRDTSPNFSPLAAVLAPMMVGGANAIRAARGQALANQLNAPVLTASSPRATGRTLEVT